MNNINNFMELLESKVGPLSSVMIRYDAGDVLAFFCDRRLPTFYVPIDVTEDKLMEYINENYEEAPREDNDVNGN